MIDTKAPAGSPVDGATRDVQVTADDGEHWFTAAYVETARWNGWVCPWFAEAEGERIAAMTEAWASDSGDAEVIEYHPEEPPSGRFTCRHPEDDPYPVDAVADPARPGVYVYGLGVRNWTWETQAG